MTDNRSIETSFPGVNQIYDPAIANSENGLCSVGVEYLGINWIARTDPFLKRIVGPFGCENRFGFSPEENRLGFFSESLETLPNG